MYNNFKSLESFKIFLNQENIENYKSSFSIDVSWELSLDLDDFFELVKKEDSVVFWHVVSSQIEDFFMSLDDAQDVLEFPSIHFKKYFEEIIHSYNESITIEDDLIGIPCEILLITSVDNIKIFSLVSLDVEIDYPDYSDTIKDIFDDAVHQYDNNRKETFLKNEQVLGKLETFLTNDKDFKLLKNDTLRREYLNKLEYKKPEIFELFKHSPYPSNPLVYLNAIYQKHKKSGRS